MLLEIDYGVASQAKGWIGMMGIKYSDDEYREAAKRMRSGPELSVSPFGSLHRSGGGAFVEMTIWVPDENAEGIRQEREFNRKAHSQACAR